MSSLYKLSISGVRSFEPKKKETIEFGKPLTLIVGANGTGKTTVIECLKYATTGLLPPNSKNGAAFVHDPNIVGDKSVSAEVKLAFTSINGQSMVASRSMQVTSTKTKISFKTTEGQLMLMNRGERTTLSTKCAELDQQVPRFLGVPPAILDYVIFCHQEESLWPLSEPSALKKKFDEIFQALQFTKAIGQLKDIKKEVSVEVKILEQSVKHLKIDKERADRMKEKLLASEKLIDDYTEANRHLKEEMEEIARESDKLFKSNQAFQETLAHVENLRHQESALEIQITRLTEETDLLPGSNDDLREKFTNFQAHLDSKNEALDSQKRDLQQKQQELTDSRGSLDTLVKDEAALQALEQRYQEHLEKRSAIQSRAKAYFQFETSTQHELENLLFNTYQSYQTELASLQSSLGENEQQKERHIRSLADKKLKESQHLEYSSSDLSTTQKAIQQAQSKLVRLSNNEAELSYAQSNLESISLKLQALKQEGKVEELNAQVKEGNLNIGRLEIEIEELGKEAARWMAQGDAMARVGLLKDEIKFKRDAFSKLRDIHSDAIDEANLDHKALVKSFEDHLRNKTEKLNDKKSFQQDLRNKLLEIESNIRHSKSEYDSLSAALKSSSAKFKAQFPEDDVSEYDSQLVEAEEDYSTALQNQKIYSTTTQFNQKALEYAKNEHSCYLCRRSYETGSGILDAFIKELERKVSGDMAKELNEQVKEAKEWVEEVRALGRDVETIRVNGPKVAQLNQLIESHSLQIDAQNTELSQVAEEISALEAEIGKLRALESPVRELNNLLGDISKLERQINEREGELSSYASSTISLDELQSQQSSKTRELKDLRRSVSQWSEDRDLKIREMSALEGQVKDVKLQISNLENAMFEKTNLQGQLEDLTKKANKLEDNVKDSKRVIASLETDILTMEEEYHKLLEANAVKLNEESKKVAEVKALYEDYRDSTTQINEFLEVTKPKLERIIRRVAEIRGVIRAREREIEAMREVISLEERKLGSTNEEFRNLRNNIDLRDLNAKISELQKEISTIDVSVAEKERQSYQNQSAYLRDRYSSLNAELAGKTGEMKQIQDQVRQTQRELAVEFKDVDQKYVTELTKFKFKSLALSDADTYAKAIDTAIMNFHSMKMKETNKIVEDLWKGTYSGTDIDTIKIRSDPTSSTSSNRSYNYRVVMVKNDVELDMRGRCSAGQKVLASIIIRLALSECFGTNCGVIALDEPTTNLDVENIESLAKSLSNIIDMRMSQRNFQLIVITHDEKFLNAMGAVKYTDHFYRIMRNPAQKSLIEWVGINRVAE